GFGGAFGVEDPDAPPCFRAEPGDGEGHGHAVVVVGGDAGGGELVGRWGGDGDRVAGGFNVGAEFFEFGFEGGEAVGFFDAQVPDVADGGFSFGEKGDDGEGLDHVGDMVHVDVDGGEFAIGGGGDGGRIGVP